MNIVRKVNMISCQDWDKLVKDTYGRPYTFQQQEGCKSRGTVHITIPEEWDKDEEMNEDIPEVINGNRMGVKFKTWLARDPKQPLDGANEDWGIELFWDRNFYPDLQTVANDLHKKGLIEKGDYLIDIDW